jgi:hypothetical protein
MEKIPDFLTENSPTSKNVHETIEPKKATNKKGIGGMIKRTIAMGTIGLGVIGNMGCDTAEEKVVTDDSTNRTEHVSKGSSLGKFYQNKFERSNKQKEIYKQALNRAKKILVDEGFTVTEKSKIEIDLKANILSGITIDGKKISVDEKYYTADEIKLIHAAESASNAMGDDISTESRGDKIKSGPIETKTVVSDEAGEFLK